MHDLYLKLSPYLVGEICPGLAEKDIYLALLIAGPARKPLEFPLSLESGPITRPPFILLSSMETYKWMEMTPQKDGLAVILIETDV